MNTKIVLILSLILYITASCKSKHEEKHLFILAGQSNMAALELQESFIPTIETEFGKEKVIIIKDAHNGQPIRRWFKNSKTIIEEGSKMESDLYDTLMNKVNEVIGKENIITVTFIWMQGERDAKEKLGEVYEKSLIGLYKQLSHDLKRQDINFIIGRLNDFDIQNEIFPHWTMIRDIQVNIAESNSRFNWVNTDDLNDGLNKEGKVVKNDLHMSKEGYKIMGKRFADKAILLIQNNK